MAEAVERCCGTCGWGNAIVSRGEDRIECIAPLPDAIADDYMRLQESDDGEHCPCWKAKE